MAMDHYYARSAHSTSWPDEPWWTVSSPAASPTELLHKTPLDAMDFYGERLQSPMPSQYTKPAPISQAASMRKYEQPSPAMHASNHDGFMASGPDAVPLRPVPPEDYVPAIGIPGEHMYPAQMRPKFDDRGHISSDHGNPTWGYHGMMLHSLDDKEFHTSAAPFAQFPKLRHAGQTPQLVHQQELSPPPLAFYPQRPGSADSSGESVDGLIAPQAQPSLEMPPQDLTAAVSPLSPASVGSDVRVPSRSGSRSAGPIGGGISKSTRRQKPIPAQARDVKAEKSTSNTRQPGIKEEAGKPSSNTGTAPPGRTAVRTMHQRPKFTLSEDRLILRLRNENKLPWQTISTFFPNRSAKALQVHYSVSLRNFDKERDWDASEDELLVDLVNEHERAMWDIIAKRLDNDAGALRCMLRFMSVQAEQSSGLNQRIEEVTNRNHARAEPHRSH